MENRVTAGADEIYCGKSAWREWLDDLLIVFAEGTHYSVEIIEARDDYVVASFAIRGYGAHSGRWIDFRWAGVTWFHNGQALRAVTYPSCDEALNAARAAASAGDFLRVRPTSGKPRV